MKVLKFGGTSVGTVESLLQVKAIVNACERGTVVVVSALGGLTDRLILTAREAAEGSLKYRDDMMEYSRRHFDIISKVVAEEKREEVKSVVGDLLGKLENIYEGVRLINHLPSETLDLIVSFGERMSSHIVAAMIDGAVRFDSLDFVKTEKWFGKNVADQQLTTQLIKEAFEKQDYDIAVVPGFISRDRDTGYITNLGRGGSDFTGALIAAALDADLLEIWTDVDGFMTADPRIVKDAFVVDHMSFIESMELCTFGAKVIYPPTIYPVFHKNIPIKILNTFHSSAPGTLITDEIIPTDLPIKGVTVLKNMSLIKVICDDEGSLTDTSSRAYNALSRHGIKIYPVALQNDTSLFSFSVSENEMIAAEQIMKREFAPEINRGNIRLECSVTHLATIAVVGENMKKENRLAGRIENTLRREEIEILAFSPGSSETTLTFMVGNDEANKALGLVHGLIFN